MKFTYEELGIKRHYLIGKGEFSIGRDANCDLVLADKLVSKKHAICVSSQGRLTVKDLGSRNGILVNGEVSREATLSDGDELRVGGIALTFDMERQSSEDLSLPAEDELARDRRVFLRVLRGGARRNQIHEVTRGSITLGTREGNDVVLKGEGVSRFHAEIFCKSGGWYVKDLGSRNGTFVNGQALSTAQLAPKDEVQLGTALVRVEIRSRLDLAGRFASLGPRGRILSVGVPLLVVFILAMRFVAPRDQVQTTPGSPDQDAAWRIEVRELLGYVNGGDFPNAGYAVERLAATHGQRPESGLLKAATDHWRRRAQHFWEVTRWGDARQSFQDLLDALRGQEGQEELVEFARRGVAVCSLEESAYGDYTTGVSLEQSGQPEKALERFQLVPRGSGYHDNSQERLAVLRGTLSQDYRDLGEGRKLDRDWAGAVVAFQTSIQYAGGDRTTAGRQLTLLIRECELNAEGKLHHDAGYDLYNEGRFEEAVAEFRQVSADSVYRGAAEKMARGIQEEVEFSRAREAYGRGDGALALRYIGELMEQSPSSKIERLRDRIVEVLQSYEAGRRAYDRRDFLNAMEPLKRTTVLEPELSNTYTAQAREMLAACAREVEQMASRRFEDGMKALEAEEWASAKAAFDEMQRFDLKRHYLAQVQARVASMAVGLYNETYFQIQLGGDKDRYPIAYDIYDLLASYLADGHEVKAEAARQREIIKKSLGPASPAGP
ncbi:MAG: FHA domain-containing protein [Planctomycetes bacterium]|nr:FHA domain-containing protein [Planctomycetota bacterium]